jgi:hypothetical protein
MPVLIIASAGARNQQPTIKPFIRSQRRLIAVSSV